MRRIAHRGAAVAVATALLWAIAGCAVGPNYERPPVAAPDAYKEMAGWKMAQPKADVLRGAWWEMFNDPELNALEEQVDISNQNIAAAEAQFREALSLVAQARASYFPTVSVGVGVARARNPRTSGTEPGTVNDFTLPINASWEPDLWGRIRRTVESARATAQASAADLEAARLSARANLAQDYFLLRAQDAQQRLLTATVGDFEKALQLTRNRYEAGVVSRADVLQAETQLETTRAQAIDVGVQRAQLEHAIALLVGKAPSALSLPPAPLAATPPTVPTGVPSGLLERRPDVAAAERSVAAANAQIGVAEAAFFPTVTLSAEGGFHSSSAAEWLVWPMRFWSVGATVSETVYDAGLRRARTDQARAAYEASVATYRQTVLAAFQAVEDNLAALRILEEEARVQDGAVNLAQQSVAVLTNQYKAGTVNYLNVITAQTTALTNERVAVGILGSRMADSVLLIEALGGGVERRRSTVGRRGVNRSTGSCVGYGEGDERMMNPMKRTMRKLLTKSIVMASLLALTIASGALAFGHGMRGHDACGHGAFLGGPRMLRALDLTADQKQKVQDILTAHRTSLAPLVANERAARQALADKLLGTGTVTPQDLDALVQQESQARTALMRERLASALEVRSILTPEQIQKAATIRAGMKDLHAQMRQLLGKQGAD